MSQASPPKFIFHKCRWVSRLLLILIFFLGGETLSFAKNNVIIEIKLPGDTIKIDSTKIILLTDSLSENSSVSENDKKRVIAALLAFPVPFGFLGLHRIYLGTDPWVPVVYIVTFGGGFGLVPLIDFFEIVFSSDEEFKSYEHNSKIFMWMK